MHHLGLVGGPVGTSPLGTLGLGDRVVNLAVIAAVSFRLAGLHCIVLVEGPVASQPLALSFGGLVDCAVGAAPTLRILVAIVLFNLAGGIVAELV